jgi:4-hydroxy-tetrahydrodipicolinate synthase
MLHFAYSAINPVAVKTLMRAVGLPAGPLRRPLQPLAPDALQQGLDICAALELDRRYGFRLGPTAMAAAE